jgi:hypothetical protein
LMISQSGDSSDKSSLGGGLMKRKDHNNLH